MWFLESAVVTAVITSSCSWELPNESSPPESELELDSTATASTDDDGDLFGSSESDMQTGDSSCDSRDALPLPRPLPLRAPLPRLLGRAGVRLRLLIAIP